MPMQPARRRRGVGWLPYALVAPVVLLLLAISIYPSVYALWLAMTDASLLRLARAQFIGIGNFVRMAGDAIFLDSLWRTLRWDLAVVLSELAIALPIALFLHRSFRGRGLVRVAMMVPYITPPAVVALLFVYMFDANFGVVNDLLMRLGVIDRVRRLAERSDAAASSVTVMAMVWYGTAADGAHPAGRAADHSRGAVRGGEGRRRHGLADVPLHHAAAPDAVDPVPAAAAHDPDVQSHRHDLS